MVAEILRHVSSIGIQVIGPGAIVTDLGGIKTQLGLIQITCFGTGNAFLALYYEVLIVCLLGHDRACMCFRTLVLMVAQGEENMTQPS